MKNLIISVNVVNIHELVVSNGDARTLWLHLPATDDELKRVCDILEVDGLDELSVFAFDTDLNICIDSDEDLDKLNNACRYLDEKLGMNYYTEIEVLNLLINEGYISKNDILECDFHVYEDITHPVIFAEDLKAFGIEIAKVNNLYNELEDNGAIKYFDFEAYARRWINYGMALYEPGHIEYSNGIEYVESGLGIILI